MTSIHPSRANLVPHTSAPTQVHALPPKPAPLVSASSSAGPSSPLSREEELRRKLLARKQRRSSDDASPAGAARMVYDSRNGGSWEDEGYRGRELLDGVEEPKSTFGILGRAKRQEKEAARRDSSVELQDSRYDSQTRGDIEPRSRIDNGEEDYRRYSRSPKRREYNDDGDGEDRNRRPDYRHYRRSISPVRMRQSSPEPQLGSQSFIHPDRLRLQTSHPGQQRHGEYARPMRDDGLRDRDRGYDERSSRLKEGRGSTNRGDTHAPRRDSPSLHRQHGLPPRPSTVLPSPDDIPSHADGEKPNSGWKQPPGVMPPFPTNRRLTPADYEQRRIQRDTMVLSVWPPSPPHPWRDPDEVDEERRSRKKRDKKRSKKSKRRAKYSSSDTESSDSEYERKRRRRREKERRKRYSDEEDSEGENRRRRDRTRTKSRERDGTLSRRDSPERDVGLDEAMWVEKGAEDEKKEKDNEGSGEEDDYGPKLPADLSAKERFKASQYSGMLYGEAEAMAAYAAEGKRIPRRGEIGLDPEKIEQFEAAGYVMSGNRHNRMNAVRLRKENQVINAEEKRAILKLQREEKVRKEGAIVSQFREMLEEKLREGKEAKE